MNYWVKMKYWSGFWRLILVVCISAFTGAFGLHIYQLHASQQPPQHDDLGYLVYIEHMPDTGESWYVKASDMHSCKNVGEGADAVIVCHPGPGVTVGIKVMWAKSGEETKSGEEF